jgi:hypothetical protein
VLGLDDREKPTETVTAEPGTPAPEEPTPA